MIVASHGSLAITNPWLHEMIQSMVHKIDLLHSNNTSIPLTRCKLLVKSSKPVRGEHEIKKILQVRKLVGLMLEMLESIIMSHQWPWQKQGLVEAISFMWIIK